MRQLNLMLLLALGAAACDESASDARVVGELASDRIELSARVSESVVEIAFAEGESVTQGQVLLRQDADLAVALLSEAEAAVAQAQARLDELVRGPRSEQISAARANLDGASKDLEFRNAEYERARDVHDRGLTSAEILDQAKAALDAAVANVRLREAQLEEMLSGTTVEELAQAEGALLAAEARRDSVRIELERHVVRAPVDGVIDVRLIELGETPTLGQTLVIMLGGEQVYARVFIPEQLRAHVDSSTNARVYVDGLNEPLTGKVRWVSAEPAFSPYYALTERDRGRLSYIAKIDILSAERRLPDGVPVEVEFLLNRP